MLEESFPQNLMKQLHSTLGNNLVRSKNLNYGLKTFEFVFAQVE